MSTEDVTALSDMTCHSCGEVTKAGHPLIVNAGLVLHLSQHPLSPAASEPGPQCENCRSTMALRFCTVCRLLLCGSCDSGEHHTKRQQGHQRISIEAWRPEHMEDCPDCERHCRHRRFPRNLVCRRSDCSQHGEALCLLCLAEGEAHAGCQYEFLDKVVAPHRTAIAECQSRLARSQTSLQALTTRLRHDEIQAYTTRDRHSATVDHTCQQLTDLAVQRRQQLKSSLAQSSDAKLQALDNQLQELHAAAQEIYQLLEETELLEAEPDTTVVASASEHLEKISRYQATTDSIPLQPRIDTVDKVDFPTGVPLRLLLQEFGIVQNVGPVNQELYEIFQYHFPSL